MIASIVLALYFSGIISLGNAIVFLYVTGIMLIVAEVAVVSFGILAFNGLIALFAAYSLQVDYVILFGIPVDWHVLFGVAFVEFACILVGIAVYMHIRKIKSTTGVEGMIGSQATVLAWSGKKGQVRIEGEIWKAYSAHRLDLTPNDEVTIEAVDKLKLVVRA